MRKEIQFIYKIIKKLKLLYQFIRKKCFLKLVTP